MGSGSSRSKVTTPVTPWSYSPEPGTPEHDIFSHQRRLTSAQRLDQIARLVAQQEPFVQHPDIAQRLTSAQRLDAIARLVAQQDHEHPNSAQRLEAIARLVAQQEHFHPPPQRNRSSSNGHQDRFQVPLYIQPSTPLKPELSDLQEMQDLQKTFDSLGIPETRVDDREERWVGHLDVGRVFGPRPDSVEDDDGDRVSSTSSVNSEPKVKNRVFKIVSQKSVSAPTSLHKWDPKVEVPSEDWDYSKKEIDGFDPDKFRRVNNKARNVSNFMASYCSSAGSHTLDANHPHSVPNYDETEERIVGSIEREYSY